MSHAAQGHHGLSSPPSRAVCARLQTGGINSDAANIELLQSAVTAEVQKLASGSDKAASAMERDMTDQMVRKLHVSSQLFLKHACNHQQQQLLCATAVRWSWVCGCTAATLHAARGKGPGGAHRARG
jgi:hypothetical protein